MAATLALAASNYTPWTCAAGTVTDSLAEIQAATCPTPASCSTVLTLAIAPSLYLTVNNTLFTLTIGTNVSVQPITLASQTGVLGYAVLTYVAANSYTLLITANAVTMDPPPPPDGPANAQGQLTVQISIDGTPALTAADGAQYVWPVPVNAQVTLTPVFTVYNCACGTACAASAPVLYELHGVPIEYQFPDLTAAFQANTDIAPFYVDGVYDSSAPAGAQGRLIMHLLCEFSASLLHMSFEPWGNYGFTWGTMGTPLFSGQQSQSFINTALVPGAVFNLMSGTEGLALTATPPPQESQYSLSLNPLDTTNPAQAWTFLLNGTGNFVLCVMNVDAPDGAWALQLVPGFGNLYNITYVAPQLCTWEYAVVPVWTDASRNSFNVAILARSILAPTTSSTDAAAATTLYIDFTDANFVPMNNGVDGSASPLSFTPPSFVRNGCATDPLILPFNLAIVSNCASIPASFTSTACWQTTPYGCVGNTDCVVGNTVAGEATCACNAYNPANAVAAKQFVADTCVVRYESSQCGAVAGTATSSCSGWSMPGVREACALACTYATEADGNTLFCDGAAEQFCAAHPHMGDCACLNVLNSSFPVTSENNKSFPGAQAALFNQFGLSGVVQLQPECFWPTCGTGGAGIQHSEAYRSAQCPSAITTCEVDVRNVIAQNSAVNVNIVQDCGYDTTSMLACSSTLFEQFKKYGGPVENLTSYETIVVNSLKTMDFVFLVIVSVVTLVCIGVAIWLGVKYANNT